MRIAVEVIGEHATVQVITGEPEPKPVVHPATEQEQIVYVVLHRGLFHSVWANSDTADQEAGSLTREVRVQRWAVYRGNRA